MMSLGLTAAQKKDLDYLLINHHRVDIVVQVLDLAHNYLGDVSNQFLTGQVTIDTEAEVTRQITMDLLDPDHALNLDSNSPNDGALYGDRMIRVVYIVSDPGLTRSYRIPVGCGPITNLARNGPVISLEISGKEKLTSSGMWVSVTFAKKTLKSSIVSALLVRYSGENKLSLEASTERLPKKLTLTRSSVPWIEAKSLAYGIGKRLFYDARGYAVSRKSSTAVQYVFTDRVLISPPQITFDMSAAINAVQVIGAKPKGHKHKVHASAVAPRSHPLSPAALGRNGVKRYLILTIEDGSLKSTRACQKRANDELEAGLTIATDVSFDAFAIPYLEEWDRVQLVSSGGSVAFIYRKATIPLVASEVSNVGYTSNVTPHRAKIRR